MIWLILYILSLIFVGFLFYAMLRIESVEFDRELKSMTVQDLFILILVIAISIIPVVGLVLTIGFTYKALQDYYLSDIIEKWRSNCGNW